jgi:hypothetical protein
MSDMAEFWIFCRRRNRVFGLRRYSHVAFDKEPLKADALSTPSTIEVVPFDFRSGPF